MGKVINGAASTPAAEFLEINLKFRGFQLMLGKPQLITFHSSPSSEKVTDVATCVTTPGVYQFPSARTRRTHLNTRSTTAECLAPEVRGATPWRRRPDDHDSTLVQLKYSQQQRCPDVCSIAGVRYRRQHKKHPPLPQSVSHCKTARRHRIDLRNNLHEQVQRQDYRHRSAYLADLTYIMPIVLAKVSPALAGVQSSMNRNSC